MSGTKLTKKSVEAVAPGAKDVILRDAEIKGFLCKITPKGKRSYLLYYRTKEGQERKPLIGVHGDITCEQARSIALDWKALIAQGGDPSGDKKSLRGSPVVAQLCQRYMEEYAVPRKKPSSLRNDDQMIRNNVLPAIGQRKVAAISTDDIAQIHHSMRETPYRANRVLALLSKVFQLAEVWKLRPQGSNPAQLIQKYPEEKRERFLTADELERLGTVLNVAEDERLASPQAVAAIRLLLLTGCRLTEILTLRWGDIDWERGLLRLEQTKTGYQARPIGSVVLDYLRTLSWKDQYEWVIPGRHPTKPYNNLSKPWKRICERAGIEGVRLHDLRHTHASQAAGAGHSLPIIGKLLGHTQAATTQRYAHLADDPVTAAANQVAGSIAQSLAGSNGN